MSPGAKLFLVVLGIVVAGLVIAAIRIGFVEWQRRRRTAWNRRFVDTRFSAPYEEVKQKYSKYDKPTYLRTVPDREPLPNLLRRHAS